MSLTQFQREELELLEKIEAREKVAIAEYGSLKKVPLQVDGETIRLRSYQRIRLKELRKLDDKYSKVLLFAPDLRCRGCGEIKSNLSYWDVEAKCCTHCKRNGPCKPGSYGEYFKKEIRYKVPKHLKEYLDEEDTQKSIARDLGVSQPYVSKLLNGEIKTCDEVMGKSIAEIFEIELMSVVRYELMDLAGFLEKSNITYALFARVMDISVSHLRTCKTVSEESFDLAKEHFSRIGVELC